MTATVHGTAVLAGACGLLIRGASGSGKSRLAALLIGAGARLVADDRVSLSACHGRIVASAPAALAGKLEVRGRGIVAVTWEQFAVIRLVLDLLPSVDVARLPDDADLVTTILGVTLPRQPVPASSDHAMLLAHTALRALAPQLPGLAVGSTLGMIAPLPDMAVQ